MFQTMGKRQATSKARRNKSVEHLPKMEDSIQESTEPKGNLTARGTKEEEPPLEVEEVKQETAVDSDEVTKCGPHLKDVSDIKGMLEFAPGEDKSAVARLLTPEIFNEYKG